MQDSPCPPHQIKFDTDSQKVLIDSGASAHLWNRRKDFIYYRSLFPQERKNDQVLGVSGEAITPLQNFGAYGLEFSSSIRQLVGLGGLFCQLNGPEQGSLITMI